MPYYTSVVSVLITFLLFGCGGSHNSSSSSNLGPIESKLREVSLKYQIPYELLFAVGMKESGFTPRKSSSIYRENKIGFEISETAFGLSFEELGLESIEENETLIPQIEAYAAWLRSKVDQTDLSLELGVGNNDELYDWIWQISMAHRAGNSLKKNIQVLFALEMIKTLNQGAIWQDLDSGEILTLEPRNPPLDINTSFSSPIQKNLQLVTQTSEILSVDYMQLEYQQFPDIVNKPKYIKVIHCPFNLSACLATQNTDTEKNSALIEAHYVIPQDAALIQKPIKIKQHQIPVRLTNQNGQIEIIRDAIVIMLVGDSGRYVEGERIRSDPKWYTNYQLQQLSSVVIGVCGLMHHNDPSIDEQVCMTPGKQGGVEFKAQGASESYRWGDIADFDKDIFWTYITNADQLSGTTEISFDNNKAIYLSGSDVQTQVKFIRGARKVRVEFLERCRNNKVVWSTLQTSFVRDISEVQLTRKFYSKGPNGNGQHFLRALVYGEDGSLAGWQVTDFYLENPDDEEKVFADLDGCS